MQVLFEVFLFNKVFLNITREQSIGKHEVHVVYDQRFTVHYRVISNTISHLEVFQSERIKSAKQKEGLTFFSYVEEISIGFSTCRRSG